LTPKQKNSAHRAIDFYIEQPQLLIMSPSAEKCQRQDPLRMRLAEAMAPRGNSLTRHEPRVPLGCRGGGLVIVARDFDVLWR